jgi:acetylornithine deacetylase
VNSVEKAMHLVEHLAQLGRHWREHKRHPLWCDGYFYIHPGSLMAGPTGTDNPAVYGDQAFLHCSVLYPPTERSADIRAEVEAHVAWLGDTDPWFRAHPMQVGWSLDWPAAHQLPDAPLVTSCLAAAAKVSALTGRSFGQEPAAMLGVCDASGLAQDGIAAFASGPGSIRHAHAADESVGVEEFLDASRLYAAQAIRFCGVR